MSTINDAEDKKKIIRDLVTKSIKKVVLSPLMI